jgi:hypothetical protein
LTDRNLVRLAWINLVACLVLYAASFALYFQNQPTPDWLLPFNLGIWSNLIIALFYPAMGLFIVAHRPAHRIGWVFCAIGTVAAVIEFATQFVIYGLLAQPNMPPLVSEFNWLRSFIWILIIALFALLLLYYPDGLLPSPRWRWLELMIIALPLFTLLLAFIGGWPVRKIVPLLSQGDYPTVMEPWNTLIPVTIIALFLATIISAVSLLIRWRRAGTVVRYQLKWFMLAGLLLTLSIVGTDFVINILFESENARTIASQVWAGFSIAFLLLAVTLAIFKYRLFDIDVIIRRTLLYSIITVTLALVYFGQVTVLQNLFSSITQQQSTAAIALSTLAIAALFNPLRRRIQDFIDRRFYRRKYNAEKTLAAFAASARSETDLETLSAKLLRAVQETMQPAKTTLWLKPQRRTDSI